MNDWFTAANLNSALARPGQKRPAVTDRYPADRGDRPLAANQATALPARHLSKGGDGSGAREPTFFGTRRYVRRQRSWFRRDHRISWLDGSASDNVEHTLRIWRHVS